MSDVPLHHSPADTAPADTETGPSAARVAWQDVPGWGSVASGLRLMAIAMVLGLLAYMIHRIWQTDLSQQIRAAEDPDVQMELFKSMRLGWQIFPAIGMVCMGVVAVGLWRVLRASIDPTGGPGGPFTARTLGLIACAAIAVELVYNGLWWLQSVSEDTQPWLDFLINPWVVAIVCIVVGIYLAAILAILTRLSAAVEAPMSRALIIATSVWIAWNVGFPLCVNLSETRLDMMEESPWLYLALTGGVWVIGQSVFIVAMVRLVQALKRPASTSLGELAARRAGAGLSLPGNWSEVASGLELYSSALAWRALGTIGGYLVLLFGVFGRSQPLVKLFMFAIPVIALITAVVMVVGVARFARQPGTSDAGSTAWVAAVIMGFGLLLDGYSLILVFRQLSVDTTSIGAYREMQEIAEQAQSISMWAMGLGFVALLSLLISFGQLTRYIGRPDLNSRVVSIGLFMAFIAVVVLCFRSYASEFRGDPDGILVIAIMIALTAIIAVFAYLNLVNNIAQAVRTDTDDAHLPPARILP